jgi:hypothetical protein
MAVAKEFLSWARALPELEPEPEPEPDPWKNPHRFPRIVCDDGFALSVQAASGLYCEPRDDVGPYTEVEVGFPTAKDPILTPYAESPDREDERDVRGRIPTVYPYIPLEKVFALIIKHGGTNQEGAEVLMTLLNGRGERWNG